MLNKLGVVQCIERVDCRPYTDLHCAVDGAAVPRSPV